MSDMLPDGANDPAAALDLVTAALRQDATDLDLYARVLTNSLGDTLPAGIVEVERHRTLADRLHRRQGEVAALHVHLGQQTLSLHTGRRGPVGEVVREVRGVVLSRQQIGLDAWVEELARGVMAMAASSARARQALERFLANHR